MEEKMLATEQPYERRVQWVTALYAGLIAGALLLIFSGGSPWSSGGHPTVMGRWMEHPAEVKTSNGFVIAVMHMVLAIGYAFLIVPLVHRFTPTVAVLGGAGLGAILYLVDYVVLSRVFGTVFGERELMVFLTHIVYGMLAAGAYKGLAPRKSDITI